MASNEWYDSTPLRGEGENPSVHLLIDTCTFSNEKKKIRKCDIGSESASLTEKVIMFVGETGAGKTTMINAIVNYLLRVAWEDDRRFKLILDKDEREQQSQTKSQTKWITSYTFHQTETLPYKVTLVDTPGFGECGEKENEKITNQIQTFFSTKGKGGIDHIDAVAFVVKASSVRLTSAQKDIFTSILSLFGKDIEENIFLFVTHAEVTEIERRNAAVIQAAQQADVPFTGYCICNNNVLFYQKSNSKSELAISSNNVYGLLWNETKKNLTKFFRELEDCRSKSIYLSAEVLAERRNLEVTAAGLPSLITSCVVEMNRLNVEREVLEKHREEMQNNVEFEYQVEEERINEIALTDGIRATVCNDCRITCHFPCSNNIFMRVAGVRNCAAMRWLPEFRGCSVCLSNCPVSSHANGSMMFKRVIETVTKTKEDMKQRYEVARENMSSSEYVIGVIQNNQNQAEQDVIKCVSRLRDCLSRLNKIALKSDPSLIVRSLENIENAQIKKKEPGWIQRVQVLHGLREREEQRLSQSQPVENIVQNEGEGAPSPGRLQAILNWVHLG